MLFEGKDPVLHRTIEDPDWEFEEERTHPSPLTAEESPGSSPSSAASPSFTPPRNRTKGRGRAGDRGRVPANRQMWKNTEEDDIEPTPFIFQSCTIVFNKYI